MTFTAELLEALAACRLELERARRGAKQGAIEELRPTR